MRNLVVYKTETLALTGALKLAIVAGAICCSQITNAQSVLVNYNFGSSNAACSSTPVTATNISCAASTSLSCLGNRTGVAVSTPTSFATNGTAGNSLAMQSPILGLGFLNSYFEFHLSGSMLDQYSGYKVFFSHKVSGILSAASFQYSTDGSSWTTFSNPGTNGSWTSSTIDLSGITALDFKTDVYFRFNIPLSLLGAFVDIDNFQVYSTCLKPQLNALPSSITQCDGTGVSMSVSTSGGTTPFTYQWKKNTIAISGATAAGFNISSLSAADNGNYSVAVTNACATSNSSNLALSSNPLPTITAAATASTMCFNNSSQNTGLSYSATTNSPNTYSINWNTAALTAGLANVGNNSLPASPIPVTLAANTAAGTYTGTLTVTNSNTCSSAGNVFTVTINPTGLWTGGSSGDWNTAANWCGGIPTASTNVIIPAGSTVNIQSANAVSNSVSIAAAASLVMSGIYNLSISSGGSFTNNGTFTASTSTGRVSFLGNAVISGTCSFKKIDAYGAVDFGTASTVSDTFTLQTGSSVTGHSPLYTCPSSTLLYKTGGTFVRGLEWGTGASGAGYPANVCIQNNTIINFPAAGQGYICNDLVIESGSSLRQDHSGGSASLRVGRNITINGTLSLGSNSGGDIYVGGNWVRNTGGIFNSNDRKVAFDGPSNFSGNGTSMSTITAPASLAKDNDGGFGGESFAHLWVNKTNATDSLVLLCNISITKELGLTKGVLSLRNSDVTLVSNSTATADIAPIITPANITVRYGGSGRFAVQRFIQNPTAIRSWRLLTAPLQAASAPSVNEAWMEGVVNPDKNNPSGNGGIYNPWPGYGTHITGTGGTYSAVNGFDQGTNNSSIWYGTAGVTGWATPTSTITTKITDEQGWMLFVRGDRGFVIGNQYTAAENTTLEPRGKVNTGSVSIPVVAGNQVIGNPYASAISLLNVDVAGTAGKNGTYYMWDPKMFTSYTQPGKWVAFTGVGSSFVQTTSESAYPSNGKIESGQAFVLNALSGGYVTFQESDKLPLSSSLIGINNGNAARPSTDPAVALFRTDIYVINNGNYTLTDGVLNIFSSSYSNAADAEDAKKFVNFNTKECLSILRDSIKLAIEKRKDITTVDTICLNMNKFNQLPYQFMFTASNFTYGMESYLEDKFTGSRWPISTNGATAINFVITGDSLSKAADRFRVVFSSNFGNVLPVVFTDVKALKEQDHISVQWKTSNEVNIKKYEVERSIDGVHFNKVHSIISQSNGTCSNVYEWPDLNANPGLNYYRIAAKDNDGTVHYSYITKARLQLSHSNISLYSNPVLNGIIKVRLTALDAGKYFVRLLNAEGQLVKTVLLVHTGGNAVKEIFTGQKLAKGIYNLEVYQSVSNKYSIKMLVD